MMKSKHHLDHAVAKGNLALEKAGDKRRIRLTELTLSSKYLVTVVKGADMMMFPSVSGSERAIKLVNDLVKVMLDSASERIKTKALDEERSKL